MKLELKDRNEPFRKSAWLAMQLRLTRFTINHEGYVVNDSFLSNRNTASHTPARKSEGYGHGGGGACDSLWVAGRRRCSLVL